MPNEITLEELMAEREALARPATGTARHDVPRGMMRVEGQGLPLSPNYVPDMLYPRPAPATDSNFGTAIKTGIVQDQETQKRIVAERLFPGDPRGVERVGFVEGVPVFVNDQGQLQYVSGPLARAGAALATNLPEIAMGTAGSFASSPAGGAAIGASGGRAFKRLVGNLAFDEPQTAAQVAGDIALEGAGSFVGTKAGKLAAHAMDRGRVITFGPKDLTAAEQARNHVLARTGIDLDLAQASEDRQLLALRDFISRFPGKNAELIEVRDMLAQGQFNSAVGRVLNMVGTAKPAELVGQDATDAAKATLALARKELQQQVKPHYDAAYAAVTEITDPNILALTEVKPIADAIKRARNIVNLDARRIVKVQVQRNNPQTGKVETTQEDPPLSLQLLDYTKQDLDETIEGLLRNEQLNEARALAGARDQIKEFLDNASETTIVSRTPGVPSQQVISLYQKARQHYQDVYTQTVLPLEQSAVGVLASMQPRHAQLAANILSDAGVTPTQIAMLKASLSKTNPKAYDGLVRQWLAQQWDRSQAVTESGDIINPAGKFLKHIAKTPDMQEKTLAMLPPGAAQALEDVMYAAEKLAKTPLGASRISGSNTARDLQITEWLKGRALNVMRWLVYPRQTYRESVEQRVMEEGIDSLTEALLDPTKRSQLRKVARMKPSTQQAILLGGLLTGEAAVNLTTADRRSLMPAADYYRWSGRQPIASRREPPFTPNPNQ